MVSEKQLEANRANALKSTGPRTDEGKQASSRNAVKHGLLSTEVVMFHESKEDYEAVTVPAIVGECADVCVLGGLRALWPTGRPLPGREGSSPGRDGLGSWHSTSGHASSWSES